MKLKTITIVTCVLMTACSAKLKTTSADSIIQQIQSKGSKQTLAEITANQEQWFQVLDNIQTGFIKGDPKWRDVAISLRQSSDAGGSTAIDFSIARALPHNPEMVFSTVESGILFKNLCTVPFIEQETSVENAFILDTTKALRELAGKGHLLAKKCLILFESLDR